MCQTAVAHSLGGLLVAVGFLDARSTSDRVRMGAPIFEDEHW